METPLGAIVEKLVGELVGPLATSNGLDGGDYFGRPFVLGIRFGRPDERRGLLPFDSLDKKSYVSNGIQFRRKTKNDRVMQSLRP